MRKCPLLYRAQVGQILAGLVGTRWRQRCLDLRIVQVRGRHNGYACVFGSRSLVIAWLVGKCPDAIIALFEWILQKQVRDRSILQLLDFGCWCILSNNLDLPFQAYSLGSPLFVLVIGGPNTVEMRILAQNILRHT